MHDGYAVRATSAECAASVIKVLMRIADANDFQIGHDSGGLWAVRSWMAYAIIAAAQRTDTWHVRVAPAAKGARIEVRVGTQSASITPIATGAGTYSALTTPAMGAPVTGNALYEVFYARLDYLRGNRNKWMTCREADERVRKGGVWGDNSALCNAFNMDDRHPDGNPSKRPIQKNQRPTIATVPVMCPC